MRALAFAISLALISLNSVASDSDRITQLEKEVQELKLRLANLEAPQSNTTNRQKSLAPSDGWKTLANWRSLKKGISYEDVRNTLGEPEKVKASGTFTFWYYLNRGDVTFYQDRLDGWTEPR
jgi:hypothetical protein